MHLIPSAVPLDLGPLLYSSLTVCLYTRPSFLELLLPCLLCRTHLLSTLPSLLHDQRERGRAKTPLKHNGPLETKLRVRGGGRAHPHPLGSNFRSQPKVLTLTVFAEDAETSLSYAPDLGGLDFSVLLSLYFVRKFSGRPAAVIETECPK